MTLQTAKIGSLVDIQDSEDPEGLRVFYYLVQDLKVCGDQRSLYNQPISVQHPVPHIFSHLLAFQNQAHLKCRSG